MRNAGLFVLVWYSLCSIACTGDPSADRDGDSPSGPHSGAAAGAGGDEDPEGDDEHSFGNSTADRDGGLFVHRDARTDIDEPGECGSTSVAAESVVIEEEIEVQSEVTVVKPVALYIMFDKSLSMGMAGLWEPAVAALNSFIDDEASAGLRVGLQYFPGAGSCDTGAGYDTPAVAVGELPDHAQALADSLELQNPDGYGTPIEGALRGVTEFCKQRQATQSEESCVAVLVTDGRPQYATGCSEDHAELAAIAGAAHTAGVTTFAVGLQGADFGLLDEIARQGGAPDCSPDGPGYACDVSAGAGQLGDALTSIRDTVGAVETHIETVTHVDEHRLPCEWQLPEVPEGQVFDRDKVNVKLTSDEGERTFGRVGSPASCVEDGWHFDDAEHPSRILACPQSCDLIESLPNARIDILLGCATIALE